MQVNFKTERKENKKTEIDFSVLLLTNLYLSRNTIPNSLDNLQVIPSILLRNL